jgi:DNA primase
MPRIPDVEVSRLKQAVPLTRLAEARGVVLKGQGHNLIGLCPFHDDREPSLVVDPEKNLWNCLGACRCGGSNIDWVMKDHGVGFRVAVEIIANMAGGAAYPARPAGYETGPMKQSSARRLPNPINAEADGDALLGQVADFYHRTLAENPLATAETALA